jgi:hypothetical protein
MCLFVFYEVFLETVTSDGIQLTLFCKDVICCCLPRQPLGSFNNDATFAPSPHSFAITFKFIKHQHLRNNKLRKYANIYQ